MAQMVFKVQLGPSEVIVATDSQFSLGTCNDDSLALCSDVLSLSLPEGNWLVQAKFNLDNNTGSASNAGNKCGILSDGVLVDEIRTALASNGAAGQGEIVNLVAVFAGVAEGTTASIRCEEMESEILQLEDVVLTATKVGTVTNQ
jgi:hypothetical protein